MRLKFGLGISALVALVFATTPVVAAGPRDGLYLMSRYVYGGSLELDAYYFKAGQVVRSPVGNVATLDFAALRRATPAFIGQVTMKGDTMNVRWADGKSTESMLEVKAGDPCFAWDGGAFCPVTGFKAGERLNGSFEGGLRSTGPSGTASNLRTVTFSNAGTYHMNAQGDVSSPEGPSGFSQGEETGTYVLSGSDLTLSPAGRKPYHVLVFPYNVDDNARIKPDHVYFGGTMLQRLK